MEHDRPPVLMQLQTATFQGGARTVGDPQTSEDQIPGTGVTQSEGYDSNTIEPFVLDDDLRWHEPDDDTGVMARIRWCFMQLWCID